jgi:hypothetical protein
VSYNFRLPNITAPTPEGKLVQMQSFLYQTVEQLNWAMNSIEAGSGTGYAVQQTTVAGGGSEEKKDAVTSFNEIKSLIIKSADIVNAYYEKINARIAGEYVAQSDFGTFRELTEQHLEASSTAIEQVYTDLQQIVTDIENVEHTLIEVNAHIKSGLLYYGEDGAPVYGLEIGQRNEIDGEEVFHKYARFTSSKLSFYDSNGIEVAYISDKRLYINHITVTGSFSQGGFVDTVLADNSVVTKWIGGGS